MTDRSIVSLRRDLEDEEKLLKVKRRVLKTLAALPSDDARRRVIAATMILLRMRDP